jgi:hypothetical protein
MGKTRRVMDVTRNPVTGRRGRQDFVPRLCRSQTEASPFCCNLAKAAHVRARANACDYNVPSFPTQLGLLACH